MLLFRSSTKKVLSTLVRGNQALHLLLLKIDKESMQPLDGHDPDGIAEELKLAEDLDLVRQDSFSMYHLTTTGKRILAILKPYPSEADAFTALRR